jgi:hypothetical protein
MADAQHCTAHARSGRPCSAFAVTGTTVCRHHGGSAPQVRAAARRRVAEGKVLRIAERIGDVAGEGDALDTLDLARREAITQFEGAKRLLRRTQRRLNKAESEPARRDLLDVTRVLGECLDRMTRVAKAAADAGVAERSTRLQEEYGAQVAGAFMAALEDPIANLTAEQRGRLRVVLAAALEVA